MPTDSTIIFKEPDYQEQIFKMFKRLHHRTKYEGSGIGLAIVDLLTEKIGAKVKVDSVVGVHTTFTLELPIEKIEDNLHS